MSEVQPQILDALDRRLIAALRVDGRAPAVRLAAQLGVSRATVEKRLTRMIDGGTIVGFTVRAREASQIRAVMMIEVAGRSTAAVIRTLRQVPKIVALHTTNGAWDLIADVRAQTLVEFDRVLRDVRTIDGVLNSETSLLLTTV